MGIVYRYIDWTLTVPLQMIEFFLILSAADPNISGGMFWRLLCGTVVMLAFGYMGEEHWCDPWMGFVVGLGGWFFILSEIFAGEAGKVAATNVPESVKTAFSAMRFICQCRLVHLPPRVLLRLPLRCRRSRHSQPHLQLGRLREQDRVLLGHLARRQDGDPRQGVSDRRSETTKLFTNFPLVPA